MKNWVAEGVASDVNNFRICIVRFISDQSLCNLFLFSDKVFAPSNDIDLEKADDSDRVVEQFKRFLAGPSPSPDQPRVRPRVELDMKNIFKKKAPTVFNSHGNLSSVSAVAEQATPSTTTS